MLDKAKELGYLSHQAGTCGLHVHINRTAFGETEEDQEAVIGRILYFFEKHWEELLKLSRRTQKQLERWADRYGLKEHPKQVLDIAKGSQERYMCVNLTNYHTVEFRMFRGTLKLNTLIATLQLIDRICDCAVNLDDGEIKDLSWTTFVSGCAHLPELVQYLKERRLYVNEPVVSGGSLMLNTPPKPSTLKARAVAPWECELPSFYRVHPCGSQNVTDALRDEVSYWEPRNPIFISAPTGRGKSHFLRPCSSRTRLPAIAPC